MGVFSVTAEAADYEVGTTVLATLAAFFAWTTLYFTLCLINSKYSYEWNCRIVATFHAVTVVVMTSWSGFVQGPWPFTDAGAPNTRLHHWTCVICLGYFTWDLLWCLYFGTEGTVMILHHCLSLFGQFYVLYLGTDGVEMVATLFGSELSNPFLQLRWFLRDAGRHKTWYGEVNDHLFMLLFGFLRIIVGSYLLYTTFLSPKPNAIIKLGALALYVISWVFWFMIVSYAIRKYRKMFSKQPTDSKPSKEMDRTEENGRTGSGDTDLRRRKVGGSADSQEDAIGYSGKVGIKNGEVELKNGEVGLMTKEAGLINNLNGEAGLINGDLSLLNKEAEMHVENTSICKVESASLANGHVKVD